MYYLEMMNNDHFINKTKYEDAMLLGELIALRRTCLTNEYTMANLITVNNCPKLGTANETQNKQTTML